MSDLIKRSDAIRIMACEMYAEAQSQGYDADDIEDFMPEATAWLNDAPSIDIVRCAECKYNYNTAINHGKMQPRCDFTDRKLTENDFCSRGEREGE